MSWSMPSGPPIGSWNSGMAAAAMPNMNMGAYSAEQWTAMQQQNWQQWAQWQQQYAQWQNQFGEKYAEQMQAMQAMTGAPPPPPPSVAPPVPPPPDQPPPPLPHENNQPLYAQPQGQPTPVPPPHQIQRNTNTGYNNNFPTGNNQNWSHSESRPDTVPSTVNAEALKKLAEEERLFDIQFQKWEEEIDKWRKDNVNHPDKQAYKEYEQKFEACRVQLMERRQQMKQKRARLTENQNHIPAGNNAVVVPSATATMQSSNTYSNNQNSQKFTNPPPDYSIQIPPQQANRNNGNNQNSQKFSNPPPDYSIQKPPQQSNRNNSNNQNSQKFTNPPPDYSIQKPPQQANRNNMRNQKYNDQTQSGFSGNANQTVDPQDRQSYQNMENYSEQAPENSSFLPTSGSQKGIPGLDLVPEVEKPSVNFEVIDITAEPSEQQPLLSGPPDYTNISKGINNILGDEKIMNILSMVRDQTAPAASNKQNPMASIPSLMSNLIPNPTANVVPNEWDGNQNSFNNQQINTNMSWPNVPYNQPHSFQQNQPQRGMQNNQYSNQFTDANAQQNYNREPSHMQQNMQSGKNSLLPNLPQNFKNDSRRSFDNHGSNNNLGMPGNMEIQGNNMQDNRGMHMQGNRGPQNNRDMNNMQDNNSRPLLDNRGMSMQNRGMHMQNNSNGGIRPMSDMPMQDNRNMPLMNQPPPKPKWVDEPLFTPSVIVEYEHKPLRLKAREFIEPVHMFEYNHISKDEDNKVHNFESEVDDLFVRKPRQLEKDIPERDRYPKDERVPKEFDRRLPRELGNRRDPYRAREPVRDEYDDKRRLPPRHEERRRDDRDTYSRRDDRDSYSRRDDIHRERERDRDFNRDKFRDHISERSRSNERENRKRGRSKESELSDNSKKSKDNDHAKKAFGMPGKNVIMIDDILELPGREIRPEKIVIILRGPPGSGKSYLAKLIRDKEAEYGGTARIMSIDDYFMQEGEIEEKDPNTGKMVKKPSLKYEYDESLEESYLNSLKRAFKRSITDGYFTFLIYDAVNFHLRCYADVWNYARQNSFYVYVCTMDLDPNTCFKRNIHNRTLDDIRQICHKFMETPAHHSVLDPTTLLQSAAITEVHMEDAVDEVVVEDAQETEVESSFTSKWEKMDNAAQLARLDGISKPLRPSQLSMEDYLQIDDWIPNTAKPGKKTVRWADIEERRQQEKMRAIGFVVGQTDWNRMTDPTMGSSALTQTKYIERVRRK